MEGRREECRSGPPKTKKAAPKDGLIVVILVASHLEPGVGAALPDHFLPRGVAVEEVLQSLHGRPALGLLEDARDGQHRIGEPNSGVSSGDAYQMNAYASRYRCNRLALVYPASGNCPAGRVTEFVLMTEGRPILEVVAVDVRELAFGSGIPAGIDGMIPMERHWKQPSSLAPVYDAI